MASGPIIIFRFIADIFILQILTYKEGPRAERVNIITQKRLQSPGSLEIQTRTLHPKLYSDSYQR